MRLATTLLLLMLAGTVQAQLDPIENYLTTAERKANAVVTNAGAQGRGVAMEAGQAALNAIASFRAAYADSLRLSEAALVGQQVVLFRKIQSTMDRLDEYSRDSTTDLQGIADTLSGAVSNLPISRDIPRVTKISPLFAVENASQSGELVVRGIGLSNADPVLEVMGRQVRPNTETDTELRFPMPKRPVLGREPVVTAAALRLFERKSRFLLFSSYVAHTYPVRIATYAREIGDMVITPRRRIEFIERRDVTTPGYRCASPHGEGSNSVPANVVATAGWTIDISTVRYHSTHSDNGSFTMNTVSPAGFTGTFTCTGSGRVAALGVVIDAGSVGVEQGYFTFTETRPASRSENGAAIRRMLRWSDVVTVADLPEDTETVILEFAPFTGERLAIEGAGSNRFFRAEFNPASKIVTIAIRSIEDALRQ